MYSKERGVISTRNDTCERRGRVRGVEGGGREETACRYTYATALWLIVYRQCHIPVILTSAGMQSEPGPPASYHLYLSTLSFLCLMPVASHLFSVLTLCDCISSNATCSLVFEHAARLCTYSVDKLKQQWPKYLAQAVLTHENENHAWLLWGSYSSWVACCAHFPGHGSES